MAVSVKKAILWRREVDNHPGMLADTLQLLSEAGADLQVVMAYRYPGGENKAAIELHPVSGKKSVAAAQTAGLAPSSISTLQVEGDNRPGLGYAIAKAVGDAGINMSFVMAQVVGFRSALLRRQVRRPALRAPNGKRWAPARRKYGLRCWFL
jgi:hypothetical protein